MNPQLKYGGEAVFLVGIAYRLLRWAFNAVREGDVAPSADPTGLTLSGGAPAHMAGAALAALMRNGDPSVQIHTQTWIGSQPGNADLFPPEMLASLTAEQRAKLLETLAKTSSGSTSVHVARKTWVLDGSSSDASQIPPEVLAAMTPDQRAKVNEALAKIQAEKAKP